MVAWWLPAAWLDWQPHLAAAEPWRFVTAAWVHWSALHLGANLAGIAVLAALGQVARFPAAAAWAWAAAWPLAHAGLLVQPALAHYGGASGVLHAAVAVAVCWLVVRAAAGVRVVGAAVGAGLVVKLLAEQPWLGPLVQPRGWDIAVAPLAHVSGALAGLGCALCALVTLKWRVSESGPSRPI